MIPEIIGNTNVHFVWFCYSMPQIIYEAEKPYRQLLILKHMLKKWPHVGPNKQVAKTFLEEIDNPLRYSQVDLYTILQHCHSYKDPLIYQTNY